MSKNTAAETTLISLIIHLLPNGSLIFLQLIIPVLLRANEKVQAERAAIALIESTEETTFLSTLLPNVLLAFSAAFTLNFILILFYSREKKNPEADSMSGTCAHFEIKKPEIS